MTVHPRGAAERLHLVERQRFGPRDALVDTERSLECRDRIVGQRDRDGELARDFAAFARELGRHGRIGKHARDFFPGLFAGGEKFLQPGLARFEQTFKYAAAIALEPSLGELGVRFRVRCGIGEREQHLHQR